MIRYIVITFCFTSVVFAQSILTLEQAIEYGLTNSKDIAIIQNDVEIIKNTNHAGAAGLLPMVNISSGYNGSVNDTELEFNPFLDLGGDMGSEIEASEAKSSNINSSIGLTYRLFNGFNGIYTLRKFKTQNSLADENIRLQIENKILDIVNQYFDLLNKQNIYQTFQTTYNISLDRYNQALEKNKFGSISKRELLNIEVILNEDKIKVDEALIGMNSSMLNLALIMGVPESSFIIKQEFNFNNQLVLEDLIAKTNSNNASVVMAELNYEVAKNDLKISKSSYFPKINFNTSYNYTNQKNQMSQLSEFTTNGFRGGLTLEIPIFASNTRKKGVQNAKINLDSKSHYLENIQNTIKTALLNTYYSYTDGLNALELMKKNLNTAEKNYAMSKELYEMGQLSNLEYRESQLQLDQIRINYSVKLSTTKIQEYIIYQLSGQLKTN